MENKLYLVRKTHRLICTWVQSGDAKKRLTCIWVVAGASCAVSYAPASSEAWGVHRCA